MRWFGHCRPALLVSAVRFFSEGFDMLALSRGEGQSIIIDGNIEVKIVKWSRSSVRLAIQAPRQVTVDRDEIWRKMHPGELSPLEKAEQERKERFAREGGQAGAVPPVPPPVAPEENHPET
jgi:carbon storage regulator